MKRVRYFKVFCVVGLALIVAASSWALTPQEKQCSKVSGAVTVATPKAACAAPQAVPVRKASAILSKIPVVSSQKAGGGGLVSAEGAAAAPKAPLATVLWDQPLSTVNQNAFVDQAFGDFTSFSTYLADDFNNASPWSIGTIFIPGDGWNGFSTLLNATSLTWSIYADAGGVPDGYPGGGNPPYWTLTLPPSDAQVALTAGTPGGYPSTTTLTLTTPFSLPAGTWWLIFYPTMNFSGGGQFGRQSADTNNGAVAKLINPGGGFGLGTGYQDWTVLSGALHDMAFRLESGCTETVADGSFEAGTPNPSWAETSTNFGTPLCTVGACGNGGGTAGPHTGAWWAWFGGTGAAEAGSVQQNVTLPVGTATLTFWAWYGNLGSPTDYTRALLDGNEVWRANGDSVAYPSYTQVSVDVSGYADGGVHLLRFESYKAAGPTYNFNIDDVSLIGCAGCPTITLSPTTLPVPILGVPYSQTITASGGTAPYTFAVTAGALPPGLTLSSGGVLSGTMTTLAPLSFTVTATDSNGCTGEQAYSVSTYSAFFKDDLGRSLMCVNRLTGAYTYQILAGAGVGVYTGTCVVMNGGAKYVNQVGAANKLNVTFDAVRRKASGYFITAGNAYSPLSDANTANNTGGCP